jgi:peptidoglycan hydrolase-like protein with peptidoglycan-binding domain
MTKSSKLRTLERGMGGRDVMAIQHALNIRTNGRCLPENGHFGPLTEALVREYKEKNGLATMGGWAMIRAARCSQSVSAQPRLSVRRARNLGSGLSMGQLN